MNLLYTLLFSTFFATMNAHPIHVSVTNMEWVKTENHFTVSFKLFKDDFQHVINSTYGTEMDLFANDADAQALASAEEITQYVNKHFALKWEDNTYSVEKLNKVNINDDSIWLYYTIRYNKPQTINNLNITNSILTDLFTDQTNLLIFASPSGEKGYRFNLQQQSKTIKLK